LSESAGSRVKLGRHLSGECLRFAVENGKVIAVVTFQSREGVVPFCASCGSPVEGRFCPKCGAQMPDVGAGGPPPPNYQSAPPPGYQGPQGAPPPAAQSGLTTNVASALCYLFGLVTGIIFLAIAPYNQDKTVRFHAFQSIFWNLAFFVIYIAVMIISTIAVAILSIFGMLFYLLLLVVWLGFMASWLYLMWKAYNNERVVLPIIGPLAEKQA
jgi:uncharacterized membrane protein